MKSDNICPICSTPKIKDNVSVKNECKMCGYAYIEKVYEDRTNIILINERWE